MRHHTAMIVSVSPVLVLVAPGRVRSHSTPEAIPFGRALGLNSPLRKTRYPIRSDTDLQWMSLWTE